jgi:hypothetical protein
MVASLKDATRAAPQVPPSAKLPSRGRSGRSAAPIRDLCE